MTVAATLVFLSNSNNGKRICFGSNNRRWSKEREQKRDEKGVGNGGGQGDGSDIVQVTMKGDPSISCKTLRAIGISVANLVVKFATYEIGQKAVTNFATTTSSRKMWLLFTLGDLELTTARTTVARRLRAHCWELHNVGLINHSNCGILGASLVSEVGGNAVRDVMLEMIISVKEIIFSSSSSSEHHYHCFSPSKFSVGLVSLLQNSSGSGCPNGILTDALFHKVGFSEIFFKCRLALRLVSVISRLYRMSHVYFVIEEVEYKRDLPGLVVQNAGLGLQCSEDPAYLSTTIALLGTCNFPSMAT
ncbi:hypothetical protein M9H77_36182 [Catharanthus roseus]|uniref:Uncharacterized protein n=1 Tax=Catharanthus roseus TaxID=4058 RepID=A0ACB9ZVC0_CATRO|nr:hypothetical protein M9H77_36182 [Catharanthus roseus]